VVMCPLSHVTGVAVHQTAANRVRHDDDAPMMGRRTVRFEKCAPGTADWSLRLAEANEFESEESP
jgi:hypothetical protein